MLTRGMEVAQEQPVAVGSWRAWELPYGFSQN